MEDDVDGQTQPETRGSTVEAAPEPAPPAEVPADLGPDAEAVPAAELVPVAPPTGSRSPRARWVIAGVVVAGTIAVVAFAASLLGARATPEALRFIPADAVIVMELRPELPGDQHAAVGDLLAHFPGFKDQSILDQKIDETLDLLVERASDGGVDYLTEIKPLLAGPAFIASGEVADASSGPFIAALTTDGTRDCRTAMGDTSADTETYDGVEIRIMPGPGRSSVACGFVGKVALIGDPESVRAAIDAKRSGDGIAGTTFYRDASKALRGDRLASVVIDTGGILTTVTEMDPSLSDMLDALAPGAIPPWVAMSVWAEPNGLIAEATTPTPTSVAGASPAPSVGPSRLSALAPRLPASTVAVVEVRDVGARMIAALQATGGDPDAGAMLDELEAATAMFGGLSGLTGWIGDASVVVTLDDGTPSGGLVVRATDPAKAASMFDSLRNLLVIAGSGSGISVDTVDRRGTEITLVDLGDLSGLLGELGGMTEMPTLDEPIVLAWAVMDDLAIVGAGEEFVVAVIDAEAGSSLADSDAYRDAIELAGDVNDGQGYVDVAALLAFVGAQLTGADAERWRTEIEPWLAPLGGAAFMSGRDDGLTTSRFVFTVR